jgi:hypothetical protein
MSHASAEFAPILMPRWLHTMDPAAEAAIGRMIAKQFALLMQQEGIHAFEMLRSAACAHEAGHAIVETILGARVKSVRIHTCPQLVKLGVSHAWGGMTLCHGDTGWGVTEDTPVREVRHRIYRMVAGAATTWRPGRESTTRSTGTNTHRCSPRPSITGRI